MNSKEELCTAALSSMTYALKAQKALSAVGIYSYIVKLDSSATRRGCTYGVTFYCGDTSSARRALANAHLNVTQYVKGSGELV